MILRLRLFFGLTNYWFYTFQTRSGQTFTVTCDADTDYFPFHILQNQLVERFGETKITFFRSISKKEYISHGKTAHTKLSLHESA